MMQLIRSLLKETKTQMQRFRQKPHWDALLHSRFMVENKIKHDCKTNRKIGPELVARQQQQRHKERR